MCRDEAKGDLQVHASHLDGAIVDRRQVADVLVDWF